MSRSRTQFVRASGGTESDNEGTNHGLTTRTFMYGRIVVVGHASIDELFFDLLVFHIVEVFHGHLLHLLVVVEVVVRSQTRRIQRQTRRIRRQLKKTKKGGERKGG